MGFPEGESTTSSTDTSSLPCSFSTRSLYGPVSALTPSLIVMLEVKGSSLLTILILPGVSLISFANKCHLFVMGYFDIISAVQVWDLVRLIVAWIRSSLLVILPM